jgi:hypothetical protein
MVGTLAGAWSTEVPGSIPLRFREVARKARAC